MKTQKFHVAEKDKETILKVAGGSQVKSVAGAIVKSIREGKIPVIVAIGAGAVNQAVKSICVARGMVAPEGLNLAMVPGFKDEEIAGEPKTAIAMRVISLS